MIFNTSICVCVMKSSILLVQAHPEYKALKTRALKWNPPRHSSVFVLFMFCFLETAWRHAVPMGRRKTNTTHSLSNHNYCARLLALQEPRSMRTQEQTSELIKVHQERPPVERVEEHGDHSERHDGRQRPTAVFNTPSATNHTDNFSILDIYHFL